jgi:hypothetical protein
MHSLTVFINLQRVLGNTLLFGGMPLAFSFGGH